MQHACWILAVLIVTRAPPASNGTVEFGKEKFTHTSLFEVKEVRKQIPSGLLALDGGGAPQGVETALVDNDSNSSATNTQGPDMLSAHANPALAETFCAFFELDGLIPSSLIERISNAQSTRPGFVGGSQGVLESFQTNRVQARSKTLHYITPIYRPRGKTLHYITPVYRPRHLL